MTLITTQTIKELRESTGAGMMDCKRALEEANGDHNLAIEYLRKKGQKISLSRADKTINEGAVFLQIASDKKFGAILVMACETDFVALTTDFQSLGNDIVTFAVRGKIKTLDELIGSKINGSLVSELITLLSGKVGEKINIKTYKIIDSACVVSYMHTGNKLGVLLGLEGTCDSKGIGTDIAMQIAAMNPLAIRVEDIDPLIVDKEFTIAREKAKDSGKPAEISEKIAQGMVSKILEQNALLCQPFIKNNNVTVQQYLKAELPTVSIKKFIRLSVG